MNFHNLFESGTQEFHWYENPSQEQIKDVAGDQSKVRFVAYPDKKIIVYPYDESPKEFLGAIGKPMEPEKAVHGIAIKAGFGWIVKSIVNINHFKPNSNFDWIGDYFVIKHLMKKDYDISKEEVIKMMDTGGRHQPQNRISGEKQTLKDFIQKRNKIYPNYEKGEKN